MGIKDSQMGDRGRAVSPSTLIECIDAGVMPYGKALDWQEALAEERRQGKIPDHLLLLEHPPVYTLGRRDSSPDLLRDEDWIRRNGMEIFKTDRGGRVTYHGPGQLVGYLIFSLQDTIPRLVWKIEETLIRLLASFHLEGERDEKYPGIWSDKKKIAALGLRIKRNVTTHGFALNVSCDLKPFQYIYPCGIRDRGVTSLEKELGWRPSLREVKQRLVQELASVFQTDISIQGTSTHPE